jgi:hypothetical protein
LHSIVRSKGGDSETDSGGIAATISGQERG